MISQGGFVKTFLKAIFLFLLLSVTSATGKEVLGIVLPFKEVVVSASTENTVQKLEVEIGSEVKKGDILARLDSRIHELQVKRFERVLTLSNTTYQSTSQLVKDDIISKEEALKAEIERDLAQTQLEVAKVELSQQTIHSPMNGIIVEALKEEGEMVKKTEEMFVLINIDKVYLQLFLPAEVAYSIQKDQELEIHFPVMPEKKNFKGKVYFIDPRIDATSGLLRTRILLDNPNHEIKAGMRGKVILPE
jgi:membrane fusion protein (multidrug efflux system)